ncbi:protein SFI1 homolog isoform X2 [Ischnura elegans]|uniref:protein SFI1 homolog isoform X2 n=1 Tax=Ischnura elegans TaxID=197161 RepID=UPI001ED8AC4F|nr:protein SFI1 homolog isoform X2 [Ischnura elegans]
MGLVLDRKYPLKFGDGRNTRKQKSYCSLSLHSEDSDLPFPLRCQDFYCKDLLRYTFSKWKDVWWWRKTERELCLNASCHYESNLRVNAFNRWKLLVSYSRKSQKKLNESLLYFSHKPLASSYKKLQIRNTVLRGLKGIQRLNRQLIAVLIFKQRYLLSMKIMIGSYCGQTMDAIASAVWAFSLQRTAFNSWRMCIMNKVVRYPIQKKGMVAFNANVYHKQIRKSLFEKGIEIGAKIKLRSSWLAWKALVEQEEISDNLLEYEKARALYRKVLIAKCFQKLFLYYKYRKRKALLCRKAHIFSQGVLRSYYFQVWEIRWREKCHLRMLSEKGVAMYEKNTKRVVVKLWRKRLHEIKKISHLENSALAHLKHQMLKKYFTCWLQNAEESKRMQALTLEAIHISDIKLKCLAMERWKQLVAQKRKKQQYFSEIRIVYENTLKLNMLRAWFSYVSVSPLQVQKAEAFMTELSEKILKNIFLEWKNVVHKKKTSVILFHAFQSKHQKAIKSRTLNKWKMQVISQKKKMYLNSYCYAQVKETRDSYLKICCLTYWRDTYREAIQVTLLMKKAVTFHEKAVLSSYFAHWQDYHLIQLHKKIIRENVNKFTSTRIQSYLLTWYSVYQQKKSENENLKVAAQLWDVFNKKGALKKWRLYKDYRKTKKRGFVLAVEKHKQIMQGAVISQLIKASIVKKIRQEEAFLEIFLKMNARHFQLGIKYGERWREKVWWTKKALRTKQKQCEQGAIKQDKRNNHHLSTYTNQRLTFPKTQLLISHGAMNKVTARSEPRVPDFLQYLKNPTFQKVP